MRLEIAFGEGEGLGFSLLGGDGNPRPTHDGGTGINGGTRRSYLLLLAPVRTNSVSRRDDKRSVSNKINIITSDIRRV